MALMMIYLLVRTMQKERKTSALSSYCTKLLSFYGILLNTVALTPFFNIFVSTLYCSKSTVTG